MFEEKYKNYIQLVSSELSEYRRIHSLEVAKSCVYLAEKYGADKEKMYVAGLLHDITKEYSQQRHFEVFEKHNISLTAVEMHTSKLWHAMSAAAYIGNELGITDSDIISSVRYHTTGRENMSLCEKILFIADFISADRNYNGVEEMRRRAEKSLESAMEFGIAFTVGDLADKLSAIHPDTISAYNDIILNYRKKGLI